MDRDKIKVLIGSKNPTKVNAVSSAFKKAFPGLLFSFIKTNAPSNVSDQPIGDAETKKGCKNRLKYIHKKEVADFYVSIEGGVSFEKKNLFAFAWVFIKSKGLLSKSKTSMFLLPKEIKDLIEQGEELGEADDVVFNRKDSKKKDGAVGILTKGLITRKSYYEEAVVLALIPFVNKGLVFNY